MNWNRPDHNYEIQVLKNMINMFEDHTEMEEEFTQNDKTFLYEVARWVHTRPTQCFGYDQKPSVVGLPCVTQMDIAAKATITQVACVTSAAKKLGKKKPLRSLRENNEAWTVSKRCLKNSRKQYFRRTKNSAFLKKN